MYARARSSAGVNGHGSIEISGVVYLHQLRIWPLLLEIDFKMWTSLFLSQSKLFVGMGEEEEVGNTVEKLVYFCFLLFLKWKNRQGRGWCRMSLIYSQEE